MQVPLSKGQIDDDFLDMLHFFACGALGTYNYRPENVNIKKVLCYAKQQGVREIVYQAVQRNGSYYLDPEEVRCFLVNTWWNLKRLNLMDDVYKELDKKNIHFCILKGESLSGLYADPYLRISTDTDIYVREADMSVIIELFKNHGFEFLSLSPHSNHYICCRNFCGIVEIHTKINNGFSRGIFDDPKYGNTDKFLSVDNLRGGKIPVLGITDNLIFIFLHFIKHFKKKGAGIRQIADIVLYVKKYKTEIDVKSFYRIIEDYGYIKIFNFVLGFGIEYFGIAAESLFECDYDRELLEMLLIDIYEGGVFGGEDGSRFVLNGLFELGNTNSFKCFWNKVVPSSCVIKIRFPYVKKFPFLYPIGVLHRGIEFFCRIIYSLVFSSNKVKNRKRLVNELELVKGRL